MSVNKTFKIQAKKCLKKHYWIFVAACLLASLLGLRYTITINLVQMAALEGTGIVHSVTEKDFPLRLLGYRDNRAADVFAKVAFGKIDKGKEISDKISDDNKKAETRYLRAVEMGYRDGIFAQIANTLSSGYIFVLLFTGIRSIVGSDNGAVVVFIVLSFMAIMLFWACVLNVYRAIYRRIFLEGYIYDEVPIRTFIYFISIRRYLKAVRTMLVVYSLKILWSFTVIGGFIKCCSYFAVPYIVSENPDISPSETLKLSTEMMNGHKLELFRLKISFAGWYFLDFLTLGIVGILFLNPYKEACFTNFYVHVRALAKKKEINNAVLLKDEYLYKKAGKERLSEVYADIITLSEICEKTEKQSLGGNKVWRFFANIFGIVPFYSKTEQEYFEYNLNKVKISSFRKIIDGKCYPARLNPVIMNNQEKKIEFLNFRRHYSVWSLILIFFILSFTGWLWEVCFHLVEDGRFVNRGIMQGPWLPIYGSGVLMILVFLNKLRANPVILFCTSIVLCGVVEYFTGLLLESAFGEMWWDYNGFFMNINGRVCAEGLVFFGIGGMVVVYFLAPLLDNILRKVRLRVLLPLCVVLVLSIIADGVYSYFNPNVGKGITEYEIPTAFVQQVGVPTGHFRVYIKRDYN
ncbi:MAG: DUF975 family protein [Oscillospiraceae bacterium]|nr:DUF975 family protein [Oscillospiraceae bacterium]